MNKQTYYSEYANDNSKLHIIVTYMIWYYRYI